MTVEDCWRPNARLARARRQIVCISLLGFLFGLLVLSASPTFSAEVKLETGDPPPDLAWITVAGDTLSWSTLRNDQPLVMVFWATWCKACKKEWPELEKLANRHAGRAGSPAWAWTSLGEPAEKVAPVAKERGLPGIVLVDPKEKNGKALGIHFVPTLCVLDAGGAVSYFGPVKFKKLEKLLETFHTTAQEGDVQPQ